MKSEHLRDKIHLSHLHRPHLRAATHQLGTKTEHLLKDPRFWAVLAMIAITVLIIAMAIWSRPGGNGDTNPIIPGPYIY